ncbi:MAG: glucosamine-6-phosphate deaminase [Lactobacillales bacterium]|jgi:glucosamine-6-phosphate deaminase|nr:glucosamine-6-phosphate deaminase [Lactobacillales bacterium]
MKILKTEDRVKGSKKAFFEFQNAYEKGAKVFGLATGSTPIELYRELRESRMDFSNLISINLDEYVGLDGKDKQSYRTFMYEQLFCAKPFKESFVPNGKASDLVVETKRYDEILQKYPIDLQILGIGNNGHIGFNEPGTSFSSMTHIVKLTDSTIQANQHFFEKQEDVPTMAISMGIKSITDAKKILLLAWGEAKADAIKAMIEGEMTEEVPASVLQRHSDVVVIVDDAAGSKL